MVPSPGEPWMTSSTLPWMHDSEVMAAGCSQTSGDSEVMAAGCSQTSRDPEIVAAGCSQTRPILILDQKAILWNHICHGIDQVYEQSGMPKSRYMRLYTHVHNFCTNLLNCKAFYIYGGRKYYPGGPTSHAHLACQELYERLKERIRLHLRKLILLQKGFMGEAALIFYCRQWDNFRFRSKVLNGIFAYLNRAWIPKEFAERNIHVQDIYETAIAMWKYVIFEELKYKVTASVLQLIQKDRNGEVVNNSLISGVVGSYVEMGVEKEQSHMVTAVPPIRRFNGNYYIYVTYFEVHFMHDTEEFYTQESLKFLSNSCVTEYMKMAGRRLQEEEKRLELYLPTITFLKVQSVCVNILVEKQLEIFNQEFPNLLQSQKDDDLRRMYELVGRLENSYGIMIDHLQNHIYSEGLAVLQDLGSNTIVEPKQYVDAIFDVYKKYSGVIQRVFRNNTKFAAALDKACGKFINRNAVTNAKIPGQTSPILLARYCDMVLKKSNINSNDHETEELLNHAILIFSFLEDKDVFEKVYSRKLANRLVQDLSASDESEASMLAKLKQACGYEYANKLQQMFQDIRLSKDMNKEFKKYIRNRKTNLGFDFSILVLSWGKWPFEHRSEFTLPSELEMSIRNFSTFYNAKHNGRKLTWLYNISKGDIITNCYTHSTRRYVFQSSTFQMAILLLFNTSEFWRVSEIAEATRLKEELLLEILQIMLKAKVLVCSNAIDDLNNDSVITWFRNYKNRRTRVDINLPVKVETKREQEQVDKGVEEDRQVLIQAAIVRIMKMRKIMKHQNLITEVISQLSVRFNPRIPAIKRSIDILIEKEFLERSDIEKDSYSYMA